MTANIALDRSITLADEGLIVGNKGRWDLFLRVADDRISFVNNGSEVAFISGNMLQPPRQSSPSSIQVGEWLAEWLWVAAHENEPRPAVPSWSR